MDHTKKHIVTPPPTRRGFLGRATAALGLVAAGSMSGCATRGAGGGAASGGGTDPGPCVTTGEDILGPFHRDDAPFRQDLNPGDVDGTPLIIEGRVFSEDCTTPLANAVVDVWHCTPDGDYDNDTSAFELRGRIRTDASGYYVFSTVQPGRYLNGAELRPMHIHYRVEAEDHVELVTQLYFAGDEFIDSDPWATEERAVPLTDDGDGGLVGTFDIVLAVA